MGLVKVGGNDMGSRQPKVTKWSAQQRKFMEWVATPEDLREHRNLTAFAASIGVDRVTTWKWRRLPGFNAEIQEQAKTHLGSALPEVLTALKNLAMLGNFNHIKLYLEMLGMYNPKATIDINIVHQEAERIAAETGQEVDALLAEANAIVEQARTR